jgi:hypothetical protein
MSRVAILGLGFATVVALACLGWQISYTAGAVDAIRHCGIKPAIEIYGRAP